MLGIFLSIPIAGFRPGAAREFWETHPLPPPSTLYGCLLSMVGEVDRERHLGVRCTSGLLGQPHRSTVLRKLWRVKELGGKSNATAGNGANVRPDYQQLLTNIRLAAFVDSADEINESDTLEERLASALDPKRRGEIQRFGGLSLGESTHMIDEVLPLSRVETNDFKKLEIYLTDENGNLTLPVWVDHVGASGTRYVTGRLVSYQEEYPDRSRLPMIDDGSVNQLLAQNEG